MPGGSGTVFASKKRRPAFLDLQAANHPSAFPRNYRPLQDPVSVVSMLAKHSHPLFSPTEMAIKLQRNKGASAILMLYFFMNLLVLLIVLMLLFGGGGFYLGGPMVGGGGFGFILLILLVLLFTGNLGRK
jgi:hypothetical protein